MGGKSDFRPTEVLKISFGGRTKGPRGAQELSPNNSDDIEGLHQDAKSVSIIETQIVQKSTQRNLPLSVLTPFPNAVEITHNTRSGSQKEAVEISV